MDYTSPVRYVYVVALIPCAAHGDRGGFEGDTTRGLTHRPTPMGRLSYFLSYTTSAPAVSRGDLETFFCCCKAQFMRALSIPAVGNSYRAWFKRFTMMLSTYELATATANSRKASDQLCLSTTIQQQKKKTNFNVRRRDGQLLKWRKKCDSVILLYTVLTSIDLPQKYYMYLC